MSSPEHKPMMSQKTPPKGPLVLLGLLSVATFAGPFVIYLTLRGGERPEWPPDRAVEWVALCGVIMMVVGLLTACVTSGLWSRPKC